MSVAAKLPDECPEGSSTFNDGEVVDDFNPSLFQAGPLTTHLTSRRDGTVPPWIKGSRVSPAQQFVSWFNDIWHICDPSDFNEDIFSRQVVLIDPQKISKGATAASETFRLLFTYFPDLRGEVTSWAANDREVLINWRFKIVPPGSKTVYLVPVVDKFGFDEGRISWRLAHFDSISLMGYMSRVYGLGNLLGFLVQVLWKARQPNEVLLLPKMLLHLMTGIFRWYSCPPPIKGLSATAGDGIVRLTWKADPTVLSYKVSRATTIEGPYTSPSADGREVYLPYGASSYEDRNLTNGTVYWYFVKPKFALQASRPQREAAVSALLRPEGGEAARAGLESLWLK